MASVSQMKTALTLNIWTKPQVGESRKSGPLLDSRWGIHIRWLFYSMVQWAVHSPDPGGCHCCLAEVSSWQDAKSDLVSL